MTALAQNFEIWQGEDKDIEVTVYEADGVTVKDITGGSISWIVKKKVSSIEATFTKTSASGITITSGVGGVFTITLSASDTATLSPGRFYHEAKILLDAKAEIILVGEMIIYESGF